MAIPFALPIDSNSSAGRNRGAAGNRGAAQQQQQQQREAASSAGSSSSTVSGGARDLQVVALQQQLARLQAIMAGIVERGRQNVHYIPATAAPATASGTNNHHTLSYACSCATVTDLGPIGNGNARLVLIPVGTRLHQPRPYFHPATTAATSSTTNTAPFLHQQQQHPRLQQQQPLPLNVSDDELLNRGRTPLPPRGNETLPPQQRQQSSAVGHHHTHISCCCRRQQPNCRTVPTLSPRGDAVDGGASRATASSSHHVAGSVPYEYVDETDWKQVSISLLQIADRMRMRSSHSERADHVMCTCPMHSHSHHQLPWHSSDLYFNDINLTAPVNHLFTCDVGHSSVDSAAAPSPITSPPSCMQWGRLNSAQCPTAHRSRKPKSAFDDQPAPPPATEKQRWCTVRGLLGRLASHLPSLGSICTAALFVVGWNWFSKR